MTRSSSRVALEPVRAWMMLPASREPLAGIRDFAVCLSRGLQPYQDVRLLTTADDADPPAESDVLRSWRHLPVDAAPDVLYLHYQPLSWLRADMPFALRGVQRLRKAGTRVVVVFHEYQLDRKRTLRRIAARAVLRLLARAVSARADVLVATHEFVAGWLRRSGLNPRAAVSVIPVGSNIMQEADAGTPSGEAVVLFGQPAGLRADYVRSAAAALRASGRPALRWCCRDADEAWQWLRANRVPGGDVHVVAGLGDRALSRELGSAGIAFAPIVDGVSTRRTTVAAYLQHALPVVGTAGRATDPLYAHSAAFALVPIDDGAALPDLLLALLDDRAQRERMSREARRLFDEHLAWPSLARRYAALAS
jgi:glycosyltransferase involved in cell wall biosynthesis